MEAKFYSFILAVVLIFFSSSFSHAVDHYYYWNERIDLIPRGDRVLVIFKDVDLTEAAQHNELSFILSGFPADVKNIDNNTWMVKFSQRLYISNIESTIQSLSGRSNNVKLISKVYHGESASVIQYPTDEIIVRLRNLSFKHLLEFLNQQNDAYIVGNVSNERSFLIKTHDNSSVNGLELAEIYRNPEIFEFVEPNFGYAEWSLLHLIPNDPLFPDQWALRNISQSVVTGGVIAFGDDLSTMGITGADMDVTRAWDHTTGSPLITVGVFDTGIDSSHADLAANMVLGYDATTNVYGAPSDPHGHGTACAGLIAAIMNNSIGVAGIAPSSKLMNVRIFNASGSTMNSWIIRGLDTAFLNGVDVMSHSWGGGSPSAPVESSFNNNIDNGRGGLGTINLASTGNEGRNPPNYPAAYDKVVGIGASTQQDIKKSPGTGNQYWWGGNYGERSATSFLAFVAPTVCYTTATGGGYSATFNGTSASCPNAAGVAALVLSVNLGLTAAQVYEFMARGCDKVDNVFYVKDKPFGKWNDYYGYGRVNAYNSVRLAAGVDVTPPTIVHQNINSHSSTYPTNIETEIIDHDGTPVPTSGLNQPKLFYRYRVIGGVWSDFDSVEAHSNFGNFFEFQIPGFGYGTEVNYYIRGRDASGNETTFPKHATSLNPYTLCFYGVGEMFDYTDRLTSWTFDNTASNSPIINVPGAFNFPLLDVSVRIYLRHTWINDLSVITLWSPDSDAGNNRKGLWGRNYPTSTSTPSGGINGSIVNDSYSDFWKDGFMASGLWSGGEYKPDHPFQGLIGLNMDGDWRFTGRDLFGGDPANFDSIRIYLTGLDNVLSPCAKLDSPEDSIAFFPSVIEVDTFDFYLKNTGNSVLNISGHSFSGDYPEKFSVINVPPASIAAGDSGLFKLECDPFAVRSGNNEPSALDNVENAVLTILTNDPSKPDFEVSLQNDVALPVDLVEFTASVEGRNVLLNWTTAWEENNERFDLQRKSAIFEESGWVTIGSVAGSGTVYEPRNYFYEDKNLTTGKYLYRLIPVDFNGNTSADFELGQTIEIGLPTEYKLSQNYPNPFNPVTKIDFQLPKDGKVTIQVYDITGKLISTLYNNESLSANYYSVEFNGSALSSGVYFYRIQAEEFVQTKRMVLVK